MRVCFLLPLLWLLLIAGTPPAVRAQSAAVDPALYPLLEPPARSKGSKKKLGSVVPKTFALTFPLDARRRVSVGTELYVLPSFYGLLTGYQKKHVAWRYQGVPLTVGYEYVLGNPHRRLAPFVGAGASLYLTKTRLILPQTPARPSVETVAEHLSMLPPPEEPAPLYVRRYGVGYGAQASAGVRMGIGRAFYLQAQSRLRYVNGLALVGVNDSGAEFVTLDFVVGAGLHL